MEEDHKKRISARAIIIKDNSVLLMYRMKNDREFYCFSGGGLEIGETVRECCVREVYEEFGIKIKCEKLLYTYVSKKNFELFYLCSYVSGKFGTGKGEEYFAKRSDNVYIPKEIDINSIGELPIKPDCIKHALINDLASGNLFKCTDVQDFIEEDNKM